MVTPEPFENIPADTSTGNAKSSEKSVKRIMADDDETWQVEDKYPGLNKTQIGTKLGPKPARHHYVARTR